MKERVSATSLAPTAFLWHGENCGYELGMNSSFFSLCTTFSVYLWCAQSLIYGSNQSPNIQIHMLQLFCTWIWPCFLPSFLLPQAVSPSHRFLSAFLFHTLPIPAGLPNNLSVMLYMSFPPSLMYFLCGIPHHLLSALLSSLCWWLLNLLCPKPIPLGSGSCL